MHEDGVHIAPHNPWFALHYATTGLNVLGQQINPGQQISRQQALHAGEALQRRVDPDDVVVPGLGEGDAGSEDRRGEPRREAHPRILKHLLSRGRGRGRDSGACR